MNKLFRDRIPLFLIFLSFVMITISVLFLFDYSIGVEKDLRKANSSSSFAWYREGALSFDAENEGNGVTCLRKIFEESERRDITAGCMFQNDISQVVFFSCDGLPRKLKYGRMLSGSELRKADYALGYFGDSYMSDKDNLLTNTQLFFGEELKVQGVFRKNSFQPDESLWVYYGSLKSGTKDSLLRMFAEMLSGNIPLGFFMASNERNVSDEWDKFAVFCNEIGLRLTERKEERSVNQQLQLTAELSLSLIYMGIVLFGIGSMFLSILIWIHRRKEEIAILYSLGAAQRRIMLRMIMSITPTLLVSIVFSAVISLGILLRDTTVNLSYIIGLLGAALAVVVLSFVVSFFIAFRRICKNGFLSFFM